MQTLAAVMYEGRRIKGQNRQLTVTSLLVPLKLSPDSQILHTANGVHMEKREAVLAPSALITAEINQWRSCKHGHTFLPSRSIAACSGWTSMGPGYYRFHSVAATYVRSHAY
jgi:hypothetical protein